MSDRRAMEAAARWALREGRREGEPPPRAGDARATLDDPALTEALAALAATGRLSNEDVQAMRVSRRRALASLSVLGLALAGGAGLWTSGALSPTPVQVAYYETRRGEHRDVRLPDGSVLKLNGATRLAVRLESDLRQVDLERGQAFFDVAHDETRPFEVHAGDSAVRVLGTAFDVDLEHGEVKLAVHRGRVRFGSFASDEGGVIVNAGWRSHFSDGKALAPTRFDVRRQDWRDGWLDVDSMKLADLVEALNRQAGPLVLPPPRALADIAVAGRFRLDDSRGLLEAIGAGYGFAVRQEGDTLRLIPVES